MGEMEDRLNQIMQAMNELGKQEKETMKDFGQFMMGVKKDSALDHKTKELIALGMSITSRCKYCITLHVKNCLDAGATREEILDVCYPSILMGGGPALTHVVEVIKSLDEFCGCGTTK